MLKVVIEVVALPGVVIVDVPGLDAKAVHVPVPVAAIVDDPPGKITQLTVWSGPAFGLAVTVTDAVSLQPPLVQMKLYVPAALKLCITEVGEAGVVIVAVPGLVARAVHVPLPVAAIVADPPGRMIQLTV